MQPFVQNSAGLTDRNVIGDGRSATILACHQSEMTASSSPDAGAADVYLASNNTAAEVLFVAAPALDTADVSVCPDVYTIPSTVCDQGDSRSIDSLRSVRSRSRSLLSNKDQVGMAHVPNML